MDIKNAKENMLQAGKVLAAFAVVASALVALTHLLTEDTIIENERLALLNSLHALVPKDLHDNDMYVDNITLTDTSLNYRNKPLTVYRARQGNKNVAAIFNVIAGEGYSGPINLLVAINAKGKVMGVRVITHKETPGLGDAIDTEKSDWILTFDNRSLMNPQEKQWRVKKDGGVFDQLTGATVTPRAIVKTTRDTLKYFAKHKTQVFAKNGGNSNG